MPTLFQIPSRGERQNLLVEEARWSVTADDGEFLGEVWRAGDGARRAWMVHPAGFPCAFVDPAASSGYSRTTKQACVGILEQWRRNRGHTLIVDGHVLHCVQHSPPNRVRYCAVPPHPDPGAGWFPLEISYEPVTRGAFLAGWSAHTSRYRAREPWFVRRVLVCAAGSAEAMRPTDAVEAGLMKLLKGSLAKDALSRVYGSLVDTRGPGALPGRGLGCWAMQRPDGSWSVAPVFSPPLWEIRQTPGHGWTASTPDGAVVSSAADLGIVLDRLGVWRVVSQAEMQQVAGHPLVEPPLGPAP